MARPQMGVLLDAYDPGAPVAADVPERLLKTASTDRIKSARGKIEAPGAPLRADEFSAFRRRFI